MLCYSFSYTSLDEPDWVVSLCVYTQGKKVLFDQDGPSPCNK